MDRDALVDLWVDQIRPADKWLSDRPEWLRRDPVTLSLGPYDVGCPPGVLPDGFTLQLRGEYTVYERLSILLIVTSGLSNGTKMLRLCRNPNLHDVPGWHGVSTPVPAFDAEHEDDRGLIGLDRDQAVRRFCKEANIVIPAKLPPSLFTTEEDMS